MAPAYGWFFGIQPTFVTQAGRPPYSCLPLATTTTAGQAGRLRYGTGNGYFGISANDCIRHAKELAGSIAADVR